MPIRFLDMFAGIGGFRSGLERLGGFECVGYCEIDKYAKQAYDAMYPTKGEIYFADARTIDPYTLPDIDLICGGFPCQSFSIAGLRRGFQDDTRGTLFFEIARIAAVKRPAFLLLENVPGLLSHDKGRTFATILSALDELGYRNPAVSENEKRRTAAAILCGEQQPCHRQPRNLSGGTKTTALTENGKMQKTVLSADRKAALSRMRQSLPTSGDKRQGALDRLLPLVRCDRLSTPPCA